MIQDLFVTAQREDEKAEIVERMHSVFRHTVSEQQALKVAPVFHFWYECHNLPLAASTHELYLWSNRYLHELMDWIRMNCPHNGRFYTTGIYSELELVPWIH